jgi:phosphatidate cytidylyltransferase
LLNSESAPDAEGERRPVPGELAGGAEVPGQPLGPPPEETVVEADGAERHGGANEKQRFILHKPGGEPIRTGRNLPLAIGSGVVLGALVLVSIYPFPAAFVAITSAAVFLGLRELNRAVAGQGTALALPPLLAGGVAMQVCAYFGGPTWLVGATAITAIVVL